MVNDIFAKRKAKRRQSDVNINDDPWEVIIGFRDSSES